MNQTVSALPQLVLARPEFDEQEPFKGDLLRRKELADKLSGYIDRLKAGAVIGIDAPWGEGKSWFGQNWAAKLKKAEHKVIVIDAFQQDYIEDPFTLIAAEITGLLDGNDELAINLRKKAVAVMTAILPAATKAMVNIVGRFVLGSVELSKDLKGAAEAVEHSIADASEKLMAKKLADYASEKASLDGFKKALTAFAAKQEKPVVVFIDELDRCSPDFAVRLIERIKHFFEVPNLVFVLLLNRDQLEKAVKGRYGSEVDVSAYLGKFVHFFLRLPKGRVTAENPIDNHIKSYCYELIGRYVNNQVNSRKVDDFVIDMSLLATQFDMSLRDVEKAIVLYMFSNQSASGLLAYMIALKLMKPDIFYGILNEEHKAHKIQIEWIEKTIPTANDETWLAILLLGLKEIHGRAIGMPVSADENVRTCVARISGGNQPYHPFGSSLTYIAGLIDIPLEAS